MSHVFVSIAAVGTKADAEAASKAEQALRDLNEGRKTLEDDALASVKYDLKPFTSVAEQQLTWGIMPSQRCLNDPASW